jgi:hypothetical protein
MHNIRKILCAVLSCLVMVGCTAIAPSPTLTAPSAQGMGLLRGQLLSQNSQPLANRTVRLAALYGEGATQAYIADDSGGIGGLTDARGAFAIGNIPPGRYVILLVIREGVSVALMQKNGTERIIDIRADALIDLGPATITLPE